MVFQYRKRFIKNEREYTGTQIPYCESSKVLFFYKIATFFDPIGSSSGL
jgi:hypothetical protein